MEELKNDKRLNLLKLVFVFISLIFILYATITMRGMYIEGSYEMLLRLNSFDGGSFFDVFHTKSAIMTLLQFPVVFSHYIFRIENKNILMMIFSCSLLLLPFLALCWNYFLTKRTQRIDVFFWSLFVYSLILLTFSIYSVSEILLGSLLIFLLWHYMAAKIDYTKIDIVLIVLLALCMFGKYEFIIILGPVFLIASLIYANREENLKNKIVKLIIGISIYSVAVFNFSYILYAPDKLSDFMNFIQAGYNYFPHLFELCTLMSVLALICLCFAFFRKNKFSNITLFIIGFIFLISLFYLTKNIYSSLVPMMEGHLITIPCWLLPLIFIGILVFDLLKREINKEKFYNYFCIVLICGIVQTSWQIINTYFWDVNIQYMKKELYANQEALYIPSKHEEISDFYNPNLRRYIWWANYPVVSILFSDSYEQKTLLLPYDEETGNENHTFRNKLFVLPDTNLISIPYGAIIPVKNKYWDLTECAEALDKYNKENNIEIDIL